MAFIEITLKDLIILQYLRNTEPYKELLRGFKDTFHEGIKKFDVISEGAGERIWNEIVDDLLVEFIHRYESRFDVTEEERGWSLRGDHGTDQGISEFNSDFKEYLTYALWLCVKMATELGPHLKPLPIDKQTELLDRVFKMANSVDMVSPEAYKTLKNFYNEFPPENPKDFENSLAYEGRMLRYRNIEESGNVVLKEFHSRFKPKIEEMFENWQKGLKKHYGKAFNADGEKILSAIYDVLFRLLFKSHYTPGKGDIENFFRSTGVQEKKQYGKKEVGGGRLRLKGVPKATNTKRTISPEEEEKQLWTNFQFGSQADGKIMLESEMLSEDDEGNVYSPLEEEPAADGEPPDILWVKKMKEALEDLSEQEQKVLRYRNQEMEYKEIADLTGISPVNARQIFKRAMKKLKQVDSNISS